MLTSTWSIVTTLLVVLFLTMLMLEPNILDTSYFIAIFYFMYKLKK